MRSNASDSVSDIRHREDIDGLRAIAVIPVVLFHLGVPGFSGGFIGVDVFFVISGFLITSIVNREIRQGTFSLFAFYERRVRRILPALFAVAAATSIASVFVFLPQHLAAYGRSLVTTMVFLSNVGFWRSAGYFDAASHTNPLLHTWSLAVEEQFYLSFPLFLLVFRKSSMPRLVAVTGLAAAGSFVLSAWALWDHPYADFYLGPTRAWELALGCILALAKWKPAEREIYRSALATAGLLMICYSVTAFSYATPFPGPNAALPCVGAALIIFAGCAGQNRIARMLTLKPLVFVGVISYSLYLWSWPIQAYANYLVPEGLNAGATALVLLFSLIVSAASWRYVERPFRGKDALLQRKTIFACSTALAASLSVAGSVFSFTGGLPQRMSPATAASVAELTASVDDPDQNHCYESLLGATGDRVLCPIGAKKIKADFLLWGDSHAAALAFGIGVSASRHGRAGVWGFVPGCAPLLDVSNSIVPDCKRLNDSMLQIALGTDVRDVFLAANWAYAAEGASYMRGGSRGARLTDADSPFEWRHGAAENRAAFDRGIERLVHRLVLADKRVVLLASVPELKSNAPETLAKNAMWASTLDTRVERTEFLERQKYVFAEFHNLEAKYRISIVYPHVALCAETRCEIALNGKLLYKDDNHLSKFGAIYVASSLENALFGAHVTRDEH